MFDVHGEMEDRHWWFVARARIINQVLRQFVSAGDRRMIVDVGCGTGGMVNFLSDDFQCLGLDSSKTAIAKAMEMYPGRLFKCGDVQAHINNLKDETSVFLLMDVLEHIENDREFLRNLIDKLPSGGKVLITVPAKKTLWSKHDETAHHFRRYERADLESLWTGMDVKAVCVSYYNARLYPLIRLARFIGKHLKVTWGKDKTDFSVPPKLINQLLIHIFSGEATRLLSVIRNKSAKPYAVGVSLIAVLEKN